MVNKIFPEDDNKMNDIILVTYASRTGGTRGVAEAIGKTLAEGGAQVEVLSMEAVKDLTPYAAVVAGSAIRDKKWLPEAMQFIQTNRAALNHKPIAVFLVCMTLAMTNAEKYRPFVADFMQPVRALVKPVSEGLFAGILDISKVESLKDRLMFKMSVKLGTWSEGDHRDWQAIQAWAKALGPILTR